jgi:hypothetical protein
VHKFSKNVGAISKSYAPAAWCETSSVLRTNHSGVTCEPQLSDTFSPLVHVNWYTFLCARKRTAVMMLEMLGTIVQNLVVCMSRHLGLACLGLWTLCPTR